MSSIITCPVSAIVPTANRSVVLEVTLRSLSAQTHQPEEVIIVDASDKNDTEELCNKGIENLHSKIIYYKALKKGAAIQRNQGYSMAANPFILFFDDDVLFEPLCIYELWKCIENDAQVGGVNAIITNQKYLPPGKITEIMYKSISGKSLKSYAGKCFGPAWNLLPEDDDTLPKIQKVDWLNLGCTLYRRIALPSPPFSSVFTGYSMMEDLALSLTVGKNWKLYNVRSAKIFHDSQPGLHKNSSFKMSKMELINRHFVMTKILGRNKLSDYVKLFFLEFFFLISSLKSRSGIKNFLSTVLGKILAIPKLLNDH